MIQYNMIDNETDFMAQYDDMKERFSKTFPDAVKDERTVGPVHMILASIDDHMVDIAYRVTQTAITLHGENINSLKEKLESKLNIQLKEIKN